MFLCDRRVVLVIVMAVAAVACGRNDNGHREAGGDAAAQNGLPIHWVETPDSAGEVREYYKGVLRREGLEEVRGVLVATQKGASPSRSYELTEYRTNFGKLPGMTRSAGYLTIGAVVGTEREAVYRLDGGASPADARIFLRRYDELRVPKDPADLGAGSSAYGLASAATATNGRVEIREGFEEDYLKNWRIRLRVGDVLVARLVQREGTAYSLKSEATSTRLRQEGTSKDGDYQVFTFRAVEPGWTDLVFDYILPDKQVGVPFTARVKVE